MDRLVSVMGSGSFQQQTRITGTDTDALSGELMPGSPDLLFVKPAIGWNQSRARTGYCTNKDINLEYSKQQSSGGTMASIILRYTEALLIYAGAKAELGTITQTDIENTINKIHDRVGMVCLNMASITTDPFWDFPSLFPYINEIRHERHIEIAFEAQRWDGLAHWRAHHLFAGNSPRGIKYIGLNPEETYIDHLGNPSIFIGQNLYIDANELIDPYQVKFPAVLGFNPDRDYLSLNHSEKITINPNLKQHNP